MASIHVVDVEKIGLYSDSPSDADFCTVGDEVLASFKISGFAYLRHHGISMELQNRSLRSARQFFSLDTQTKMKYERFVKTGYNGYTPLGGENEENMFDFKECYDLLYPEQDYPDAEVPEFRQHLSQLANDCSQLSFRLLQALDAALGTAATGRGQLLRSCHQHMLDAGSYTGLRVLNYPAVPADVANNTIRCSEHTDYGTFTLLFQDDVGGLEVETAPGVWIPADPIPDTILVNIGDMMEVWTSGDSGHATEHSCAHSGHSGHPGQSTKLRATHHRVLLPAIGDSRRATSRQSVVYFVLPDHGTMVAPLCGTGGKQAVDAARFLRQQYGATYRTYDAENMEKP